jgi:hypothetical protein
VASQFGAQFALNVTGTTSTLAGNPDVNVFGLTDFGSLGLEASAAAVARVELGLTLGVSGAAGFPSIKAGFLLNFGFGTLGDFDPENPDLAAILAGSTRVALTEIDWGNALTDVGFVNIRLDLGSFISKLLGPTLIEIDKAIEPIKPIVKALTDPIPVISDLMGEDISLADLAGIFGECDISWVDSVAEIIAFIDDVADLASGGELYIPFGDFWVFGGTSSNTTPIWEFGADRGAIAAPTDPWGGEGLLSKLDGLMGENAAVAEGLKKLAGAGEGAPAGEATDDYGFKFPLFDEPTRVFQLLMGNDIPLVEYRMKPFSFEFEYSQFFPIIGPLGVSITGNVGIKIQIGFGYGTRGIREFVESDFKNVAA